MQRIVPRFLFAGLVTLMFRIEASSQWVVSSSVTIVDTTVTGLIVTSGGNLIARSVTVTGDATIHSGGVVTHANHDTAGLRLNVTGTLDIQSGAAIDVSGKGLWGGYSGSNSGQSGEAFDASDAIIAGAGGNGQYGAGGGYGGPGGTSVTGAVSNPPYGLLETPRHLGAGGGGGAFFGNGTPAGNGGGRITVSAGVCIVNGAIRANGGTGADQFAGAGSGGGIRVDVGSLSGTGSIQANGGGFYASGGGGRIAIYYSSSSFPVDSISSRTGVPTTPGAAGTVYLKDNAQAFGDLIVGNNNTVTSFYTPLRTMLTSLRSITVRNRGQLRMSVPDISVLTVEQPLALSSNARLWVGNSVTLSITNATGFDANILSGALLLLDTTSVLNANGMRVSGGTLTSNIDLNFPTATDLELSTSGVINMLNNKTLALDSFTPVSFLSGTVNIQAGSKLNIASNSATIGNGVTLMKDGRFGVSDTIGNLVIESGGQVTHANHDTAGLRLNVSGTLDIQSGGAIDVSGKGLWGGYSGSNSGQSGEAFDASDAIIAGAAGNGQYGAGGGYGGPGGTSVTGAVSNPPYGLLETPRHLGAGGGGGTFFGNGTPAGNGGGRITVSADVCIVNGAIRANGGTGADQFAGAGSGGGIRVDVGGLSGTGSIQANGGGFFASGGGGRIAIYYSSSSFPVDSISSRTGVPTTPGAAGTVYLKNNSMAHGDLIVGNGGVSAAQSTPVRTQQDTLRSITVRSKAYVNVRNQDVAMVVCELPVTLDSATLRLSTGAVLSSTNSSGFDISSVNSSRLILDSGSVLNADRIRISGLSVLDLSSIISFPGPTDFELSTVGSTVNILNNAVLSVGDFTTSNFQSGTINLTRNGQLNIASNHAIVGPGVTLVREGRFGSSDSLNSLIIQSGGVVTHSPYPTNGGWGLLLNIRDSLVVNGSIDVTGLGLRGAGAGGSVFADRGEGYDGAGTSVVPVGSSGSDAGGSYGGLSLGDTNPCYGVLENPTHFGSGGSGCNQGGNGGGLIQINCGGRIVINGSIKASGTKGLSCVWLAGGGGGSGGGIRLSCNQLTGAGSIYAVGGERGNTYPKAGGGGRIAIYYQTLTFPLDSILAYGGQTANVASAGTIYLKNAATTYGDLFVNNRNVVSTNFTPLKTNLPTFRTLTVTGSGSHLDIQRDFSLGNATSMRLFNNGSLRVSNNSTLSFDSFIPLSVQSGTLWISSGSRIAVATNTIQVGNGLTLMKDGSFGSTDEIGTLTIDSGGVLTHSPHFLNGLRVNVTNTLGINPGGAIDVSGKGLFGGYSGSQFTPDGETYDVNDSIALGAGGTDASRGAGGSYGGLGGNGENGNTTNLVYGQPSDPHHLGSGGGGSASNLGGNGGGRVTINAENCVVNGFIRANGANGNGAGSGGAVRVNAGNVSGSGSIEARGGNSSCGGSLCGGVGGGGRIAVYYNALLFPQANMNANAGTGGRLGTGGTIYLRPEHIGSVPGIISVTPNRGGNNGFVTAEIVGYNFRSGATVNLRRVGQPDILADSMTLNIDSTRISATIGLENVAVGNWDLFVTNLDSTQGRLNDGFMVEEGLPDAFRTLALDVLGRHEVRVDRFSTYTLNYENNGNVDVYGVTLLVVLPLNFSYRLDLPHGDVGAINWNMVPVGASIDSQIVIPIWIQSVPPFSQHSIRFSIQPPPNTPAHSLFNLGTGLRMSPATIFSNTGDYRFATQSSIYSLLVECYSDIHASYAEIFQMSDDDFADSLENWLLSNRNNFQTTPASYLALSSIASITGVSIPDSVVLSVSTKMVTLCNEYALDVEGTIEDGINSVSVVPCNEGCPHPTKIFHPPLDPPSNFCLSTDYCTIRCYKVNGERVNRNHDGIDIKMRSPSQGWTMGETPVFAMKGGRITKRGWENEHNHKSGGGKRVCIKDENGYEICYRHLDQITAPPVDSTVGAGDQVGFAGTTGHSTGPHTHIDVKDPSGHTIRPECYFGQMYDNCPPPNSPEDEPCHFGIGDLRLFEFTALMPNDPNEKDGSQGIGIQKFVSLERSFPYSVLFENVDSASAAAQTVVVRDTIRVNNFNSRTFSLGRLTFGNHIVTPPSGTKEYTTTIDLRPQDTLLVPIRVTFDSSTGIVTWRLESIDPSTGESPEDPHKGILPPNTQPPNGEGSVSFTIKALDTVAHGTVIRNRASIVFDTNPAILTGEWFNTIDSKKPRSHMLALAAVQDSLSFPVSWVGADTGSGVRDYSIYISADGGSFEPWLVNTNTTNALFTGQSNGRYRFYSIARDSVGNLELPKDTAEAVTIVTPPPASPMLASPPNGALDQQTVVDLVWHIPGTPLMRENKNKSAEGAPSSKNPKGKEIESKTVETAPQLPLQDVIGKENKEKAKALYALDTVSVSSYHMQLSANSGFTAIIYEDSTLTDTSHSVGPIDILTTYYWRIRAKNIHGVGAWSETWSFRTNDIVSVSLYAGWDIISNPVTRAPNTDSVSLIFPTSIFNHGYEFVPGSGYQQRFTLANGKGYWGKFSSTGISTITGTPRNIDSIDVAAGWNLIGSVSYSIDTATVVTVPPGLRSSLFYQYSAGYTATATIKPGNGYWVKTFGAGKLVMNAGGVLALSKSGVKAPNPLAASNSLTITDSRGAKQTLYFGSDSVLSVNTQFYELPPIGPEGSFDVRFASNRMVESFPKRAQSASRYPFTIRSGNYPITLSWDVKESDIEIELHDGLDGKQFSTKRLSGKGSVKVTNPPVDRFVILVASPEIPSEFALQQNYPNPFNPTTTFEYAIPMPSHVTFKIYNILGQEIKTLADEIQAPGFKKIEWNSVNNHGNSVATGVYFYRIEATPVAGGNPFMQVKKMLLLK